MNCSGKKFIFVVMCACLGFASSLSERRYEYLDELCKDDPSPSLRLGFHNTPQDGQALTLSLSQLEYPVGLNCCLTIVSDSYIAAELSDVNLRRNGPCIDFLEVVTETELISVCNQEDQVQRDPDDASRTIESRGSMKLTFTSNSSVETPFEDNLVLGFTIRILTFIKEKNEAACRDHYHGFLCPRLGRCLPLSTVCDGEEDCPSGHDESSAVCGDSTDLPMGTSTFYTSPSILSVVLAVISTAFLLCICFWLICASRRLMVNSNEGQIIWNLFGSNPAMMFSPSARFHRNARSVNRMFVQTAGAPPTPHPSTTIPGQEVIPLEQPPPPYETLFGARPKTNVQAEAALPP